MAHIALKNFINGHYVDSSAPTTLDITNPATGEVYATTPISVADDVDAAYAAAAAAFKVWGNTTPAQRQLALFRIADAIEARGDELADIEVRDTGKPRSVFVSEEIPQSVDQIRFFAGAARNLEGKSTGEYMPDHTSSIRREPIGVIGQVTPWNYPFMMAVWKFAPALAAGNTIVIKPSDSTPASTLWLAELVSEFVPAGVMNVVLGDRETGRLVVAHKTPQMVAITGSVRAGMQVAEAAAADLKRVHLELGGKAPVIVFDDVDLDRAVEGIAMAGYFNAGQDCTAATRVLVQKGIHDKFVAALVAHAQQTAITGPGDDAFFGALSSDVHLAKVTEAIAHLPAHARVELGGNRHGDRGYYFEATVVSGLRQEDDAIQNEIFGPVITVQPFDTEDEAIELANDVTYGLSSSVWTTNHGTAMRVSKRLDFGAVWINTHIPVVAEMPHGGFKHSGYGKDLSAYGFEDYTRIKHVMSYIGR